MINYMPLAFAAFVLMPLAYYDYRWHKVPRKLFIGCMASLFIGGLVFWHITALKFGVVAITGFVFTLSMLWILEGIRLRLMAKADVVALWVLLPLIPLQFGVTLIFALMFWIGIITFQMQMPVERRKPLPFLTLLFIAVCLSWLPLVVANNMGWMI
jgi:hypothetical protein